MKITDRRYRWSLDPIIPSRWRKKEHSITKVHSTKIQQRDRTSVHSEEGKESERISTSQLRFRFLPSLVCFLPLFNGGGDGPLPSLHFFSTGRVSMSAKGHVVIDGFGLGDIPVSDVGAPIWHHRRVDDSQPGVLLITTRRSGEPKVVTEARGEALMIPLLLLLRLLRLLVFLRSVRVLALLLRRIGGG